MSSSTLRTLKIIVFTSLVYQYFVYQKVVRNRKNLVHLQLHQIRCLLILINQGLEDSLNLFLKKWNTEKVQKLFDTVFNSGSKYN